MTNSLHRALGRPAPQSEPLPGRTDQVVNSAGGHVFAVDMWGRLDRFLILGTDGGTYYVTERDLTLQNVQVVRDCVAADPARAVSRIVRVSQSGLAPRNTQAIFALAVAASAPDPVARRAAERAAPLVCRIGTHWFRLAGYVKLLGERGWGRGLRRLFAQAFEGDPERLAYHAVKYRQREGWTYRDLLRLSHPQTTDPARKAVFDFMCGRGPGEASPAITHAFSAAQSASSSVQVAELVREANLPWEAVPDRHRQASDVQLALLERMPVTATVRQLAMFARAGMLTPMGAAEQIIVHRLTSASIIRKSMAHPLLFLDALMVHQSGGAVGRSRGAVYQPNQAVVRALESAFRLAFDNVEPTGRRTYVGLDVSGSMSGGQCAGSVALSPRMGATALALMTAVVEPLVHVAAFAGLMVPLPFSVGPSLHEALQATGRIPFGRTDCALPMLDALERGIEVDTFIVLTDSETWAGEVHPCEALRRYRREMGIDARLVVVGMTSNGFSIADPVDAGMLDVVGFSADTPAVIAAFSRGDL